MLRNSSKLRSSRVQRLNHQDGFTVLELMIVVVVIGVLAAVAIPSFQQLIANSRQSEAPTNIMAIAQGAKIHYNQERVDSKGIVVSSEFPVSTNSRFRVDSYATMPVNAPCTEIKGSPLYSKNSTRWHADKKREPWVDLKFSLTKSHYFQYGYRASSAGRFASYTVRARASLDCEKVMTTFLFRARIDKASGEIMLGEIVSASSFSN